MKKTTKIFVVLSFCMFIVSVAVFAVFAANQFSLTAGGTIDFIIEQGLEVTISAGSLEGLTEEYVGSNFHSFTVTKEDDNVQSIPGYNTWLSPLLSLDYGGEGYGRLIFTVINNSTDPNNNVLVEMTTSTTVASGITVTPSADFCINADDSHTFDIEFIAQDINKEVYEQDFTLTIELSLVETKDVGEEGEGIYNGMVFTYDDSCGEAELVSFTTTASQTNVVIPSIIKKNDRVYTISSLASAEEDSDAVFYAASSKIRSISMPNTLASIGDIAFLDCSYITGTLNLPHSLEYIGDAAFAWCSGFTGELLLSPRLEGIENNSFISASGFSGVLRIPRFVEYIGEYAFAGCYGFTGLELRDGLWSIGDMAFEECEIMGGQLILPKGMAYIGDSAFYGCNFSGDLVVPEGMISIAINAFTLAFGGSPAVLTLPSTIEFIGYEAFANTTFTKVICYAEEAPVLEEYGVGNPGDVEIYLLDYATGYGDQDSNWRSYEIYSLTHF